MSSMIVFLMVHECIGGTWMPAPGRDFLEFCHSFWHSQISSWQWVTLQDKVSYLTSLITFQLLCSIIWYWKYSAKSRKYLQTGNCCNTKVETVEKEVQGFSYCIKVTKQKFHQRKKASEREITFVQQLCCSVLQRCWHDYTSVRRIKEAVLQMTAALAKSYFFIAFASGNSDSRAKALYLSGGRLKENLSCRLHIANASAFFAWREWCLP